MRGRTERIGSTARSSVPMRPRPRRDHRHGGAAGLRQCLAHDQQMCVGRLQILSTAQADRRWVTTNAGIARCRRSRRRIQRKARRCGRCRTARSVVGARMATLRRGRASSSPRHRIQMISTACPLELRAPATSRLTNANAHARHAHAPADAPGRRAWRDRDPRDRRASPMPRAPGYRTAARRSVRLPSAG